MRPPLGLQIRSKIGLKIDQNFNAILGSFLVPLGPLVASHLGPFGRQNRTELGPKRVLKPYFCQKCNF